MELAEWLSKCILGLMEIAPFETEERLERKYTYALLLSTLYSLHETSEESDEEQRLRRLHGVWLQDGMLLRCLNLVTCKTQQIATEIGVERGADHAEAMLLVITCLGHIYDSLKCNESSTGIAQMMARGAHHVLQLMVATSEAQYEMPWLNGEGGIRFQAMRMMRELLVRAGLWSTLHECLMSLLQIVLRGKLDTELS